MWWTALIPFVLQALAIFFDEAVFHIQRGLPKWERIGHPLDTLTVIICMTYVLWIPFSVASLVIYALLVAFSTLFITKDEFVHHAHCPAQEQWLHAILFVLHPITLITAGFIWPVVQGVEVSPWISTWLTNPNLLRWFLIGQLVCMTLFMTYQILFWNVYYARSRYERD